MPNLLKDLFNPPPPTTYYIKNSDSKSQGGDLNISDSGKYSSDLVQNLISGEFQKVIDALSIKFKGNDTTSKQVVLVSHRVHALNQNKNMGLLTHEEISTETMKISEALLNLINQE